MEPAQLPFCGHFGACGGCATQDRPYAEQLAAKEAFLSALFPGVPPVKVTPSPQIQYYRNKMEFSFSHQVARKLEGPPPSLEFENRFGLKMKGRWDKAIDLKECFLMSPAVGPLLAEIRGWAAEEGLPYYDLRKHSGVLRHLLLREGKNTGRKMAVLFTAECSFEEDDFLESVESVWPGATVLHAVNKQLSDATITDELFILSGEGCIEERLCVKTPSVCKDIRFRISHKSFFQTNTLATALLYSRVAELVEQFSPAVLYDLYGGSGGFSFACGHAAKKCVSVESVAEAVADGKVNATINGVEGVEFICAAVENYLQSAPDMSSSLVLLDPPRAGLHPKALSAVIKAAPPRIIYVSCNPKSLARELQAFSQSYKIDLLEGFDLFPHTEHVEALALLTRV